MGDYNIKETKKSLDSLRARLVKQHALLPLFALVDRKQPINPDELYNRLGDLAEKMLADARTLSSVNDALSWQSEKLTAANETIERLNQANKKKLSCLYDCLEEVAGIRAENELLKKRNNIAYNYIDELLGDLTLEQQNEILQDRLDSITPPKTEGEV
jgi:uncharacterized protein YPO0396